jgi:hypothetical protein
MDKILQYLLWNHDILYADRSSKDEQRLIKPPLLETKNANGGRLKIKIRIFYGDNS